MMVTSILPMEPVAVKSPFSAPSHGFQIKWDGVRVLAFIAGGKVRLQNRRLRDRTEQYPELSALPGLVRANEVVLDGEVIVLRQGKPAFPQVLRRDWATNPMTIRHLVQTLPITYAVFDILYLDGKNLTARPWQERQEVLGRTVEEAEYLHVSENFADGQALFQAIKEREMEGVVAKTLDSPYLPGVKSSHWLKIKNRVRRVCVVGGYTVKEGNISALLLGLYQDDKLLYVGRAGSGLTWEQLRILKEHWKGQASNLNPFFTSPTGGGVELRWVKPELTVAVEFAEWTDDLKLRAPVIIGFTTTRPEDCQI